LLDCPTVELMVVALLYYLPDRILN